MLIRFHILVMLMFFISFAAPSNRRTKRSSPLLSRQKRNILAPLIAPVLDFTSNILGGRRADREKAHEQRLNQALFQQSQRHQIEKIANKINGNMDRLDKHEESILALQVRF